MTNIYSEAYDYKQEKHSEGEIMLPLSERQAVVLMKILDNIGGYDTDSYDRQEGELISFLYPRGIASMIRDSLSAFVPSTPLYDKYQEYFPKTVGIPVVHEEYNNFYFDSIKRPEKKVVPVENHHYWEFDEVM